jgi:eukaryotic-like serine/threonine-protein kinase
LPGIVGHAGDSAEPDQPALLPVRGAWPPRSILRGVSHVPESAIAGLTAFEGRVLAGRYRLTRVIGSGGFGVVFEAEDVRISRRVAIKMLLPEVASREQVAARFQREAVTVGRIEHEGIVAVTDFDRDADGVYFFAMECIDGRSLSALLRDEAPLEIDRALMIACRIAQATAAAHAAGVVHRDLKPANVLLTAVGGVDDFVKIVDFGIAKVLAHENGPDPITDTGKAVGTPLYMAPEQYLSAAWVGGRADVYALGVMLYEMLTGVPPFRGETSYEIAHLKLSRCPVPPSAARSRDRDLPKAIDRLVLRALETEPSRRLPSMREFDRQLREILDEVAPHRTPLVRPARPLTAPIGDADTCAADSVTEALSGVQDFAAPSKAPRKRAWRPWRVGGVASLVVAAAAAFTALATSGGATAVKSADESPGDASPTSRVAAPDARISMRGDAETDASGEPKAGFVDLSLTLSPAHAKVELDGVRIREHTLEIPRSAHALELQVSAPGYVTTTRTIRPVASGEVRVTLERAPAAPPRRAVPSERPRLPDSPL